MSHIIFKLEKTKDKEKKNPERKYWQKESSSI